MIDKWRIISNVINGCAGALIVGFVDNPIKKVIGIIILFGVLIVNFIDGLNAKK